MRQRRIVTTSFEVSFVELVDLLKLPKGSEIDDVRVLASPEAIVVTLKDNITAKDLAVKIDVVDPVVTPDVKPGGKP